METKKIKIESPQLNLIFEETVNLSTNLAIKQVSDGKIEFNKAFTKTEKTSKVINFNQVIIERKNNEHQKTISHIINTIKSF